MTVDDVAHVAACQLTVLVHLQFVGIDVVDAVAALQILSEERKAAREDGYLVATALEDGHQTVGALGDGQVLGNVAHDADIEAFEQADATGKTLLEVNLATHGALGDGSHLGTHTGTLSQLVDALRLNERGVHIEADETAHTAEHVVLLEREVHLHLGRELEELALHLLAVSGLAS